MKVDPDSGKIKGLSSEDIGQTLSDVVVKVSRIIYPRTDKGFVIFACEGGFSCAGQSAENIVSGACYTVSGKVTEYNGQAQIKLSSVSVKDEDSAAKAIMAEFLSENFEGIGKRIANRIVQKYGDNLIDNILNKPLEIHKSIAGLSKAVIDNLVKTVDENEKTYRKMLDYLLMGLSSKQAAEVMKYPNITSSAIMENPYILSGIEGIDFNTCERLADKYKLDPMDKLRISGAIIYTLSNLHESYKSTYFDYAKVKSETFKIINTTDPARLSDKPFDSVFLVACEHCVEQGNIVIYKFEDNKCVNTEADAPGARFSLKAYFRNEAYIKREIEKFIDSPKKVPSDEALDELIAELSSKAGIELDDCQAQALKLCMYQPISIITGGPGTGKTTIMGLLAEHFRTVNVKCEFTAPTGRAAKRLSESVNAEAHTIHRLLGARGNPDDPDTMEFTRNRDNPIDARVIVVDEMSMVDSALFADFLDAVGKSTSLILVGDPNQLPSVGCGNLLSDLISCRSIPKVELKYIHRQDDNSSIASNAYRILKGETLIPNDDDFRIISTASDEEAYKILCDLYRGTREEGTDIAILTPTKKEDALLGTVNLNKMLQEIFHFGDEISEMIEVGEDSVFMVGDKVMQTRNNYNLDCFNPITGEEDTGVFNGEIGTVTEIYAGEEKMKVLFDDGKSVIYNKKSMKDLDLAYSMTVHKSQGCEFDEVMIALGKMNPLLYKRKLLYTAVTRGKHKVTLIDSSGVLQKFLRSKSEDIRETSLKDLLKIADHKRIDRYEDLE